MVALSQSLTDAPVQSIIERLEEDLRKARTGSEVERAIRIAAKEISAYPRSALELIGYNNEYLRIRHAVLTQWSDLDFHNRMMFREMVLSTARIEKHYEQLGWENFERLKADMDSPGRDLFIFARNTNLLIFHDLWELVEKDKELADAPTADAVWNTVKYLDPMAEEIASRPLDRSKYVERDLDKWPRRTG